MKVEKIRKIAGLMASVFLMGSLALGTLASCATDDDDDGDGGKSKPEVNYKITFEDFAPATDTFSVAPGETKVLKVVAAETAGTWVVDTDNVPSKITVTKNAEGNFEVKGGAEETAENVSFTLYPQEAKAGDTSFDVTVNVSVWDPNFVLTLKLDDALAAKASKIKVAYKDGDAADAHSYTVDAVYTAGEKSAKVVMPKNTASSYGYFSGITVTAYDASETTIKTDLSKNAWVCYYSTNADYYTETEVTENTYAEAVVTINFVDFTLAATDTVKVTYGITADSNTNEVDAEISSDGTKATVTIGNDYLNASGWFEISVAITKDGAAFTEFTKSGNGWFEFSTSGISETLTKSSGDWTEIYNAAYAGTGAFEKLDAVVIPAGTTEIKVVYADMSGSASWWFQVNSDGETWEVCAGDWDSSVSGYSTEITDSDLIAALISGGFYFVSGSGVSGTLKVSVK